MFQNDLSGLYRNCIPVTGNPWGQLGFLGNTIPFAGSQVPFAGNTIPFAGTQVPFAGNTVPYGMHNQFGMTQIPCTLGHPAFGGQIPYTLGQNLGNFGYFGNVPVGHPWSNLNTIPTAGTFGQTTVPMNAFGYYGHNPFVAAQWTGQTGFGCR